MEDERKLSQELMWGSITNRLNLISDEADRLNWDDAIEMIASAFCDSQNMEPIDLFLNLYQFSFRFYFRIKGMGEKAEFNQISRTTRLEDHEDKEYFMVSNYDYNMFKWAKSKGFDNTMTNGWFLVPKDKLSVSEVHNFEKRIK